MNKRRWLVTGISLLIAAISSIAFLVDGLTAPAYVGSTSSGTSSSETVVVTETSSTLVAENGSWVILLLVFPLVATAVVALASLGSSRLPAVVVAWSVTGAVALFALVAMLTIGVFVLPVAAALVVACTDVTLKHLDARSLVPQRQL